MMGIQVIRNIRVHPRPRLERLQLTLRLTHITIKIVEVAQTLRLMSSIRIRWIISLMVFNVDKNSVVFCCCQKGLMMFEGFDGGLCYEDVDFAFDGVESDGVVRGVGGEDCYCVAGGERVDGGF